MMEKSDLSHLPEGAEFWIITKYKTSSTSGLSRNTSVLPAKVIRHFKHSGFPPGWGCSGSLEYLGTSPKPYGSNSTHKMLGSTLSSALLCLSGGFFVSERALETHLGNQDHAQLPRHSSSCIPEPFFQDQSLLLPVFGGGVRVDLIEEPLGLVQGIRARPGPPPKKHQQILVDH